MTRHGMRPVEKGNLSEQVYRGIRNALMEGQYKPGERVTINRLADELDVSTTPIREAIFRLVSDRALEMKVATAIHVPEIKADQLREIQTIRLLLEGKAAEIAAAKTSRDQLKRLEDIQTQFRLAAETDPLKAAYFNRQFHFALLGIADMPMLTSAVENMWVLMGPLLRVYHLEAPTRDLTSSGHDHYGVLEGLRRGDGEQARRAIQDDIRLGLNMVNCVEERALAGAR